MIYDQVINTVFSVNLSKAVVKLEVLDFLNTSLHGLNRCYLF